MAVFAPMPSASVSTATTVKPRFFSNWRKANLKSFMVSGQWTKSQIPNTKLQRIPKHQILMTAVRPVYWGLSFGASLGFGCWNLRPLRRSGLADDYRASADGGRFFERSDAFAPVVVVGQGRTGARHAGFRVRIDGGDEAVGFPERKGAEEDRIDDGKYDEVGAQTEGEVEHDHGSEPGNFDQFATRVFQVVHLGNPNSEFVTVIWRNLRLCRRRRGAAFRPLHCPQFPGMCFFRNPNS